MTQTIETIAMKKVDKDDSEIIPAVPQYGVSNFDRVGLTDPNDELNRLEALGPVIPASEAGEQAKNAVANEVMSAQNEEKERLASLIK